MVSYDKTRLVIHSRVLLEGVLLVDNPACEILDLVLDRVLVPVVDRNLLSTYGEKLLHPSLGLDESHAGDFLQKFTSLCQMVSPSPLPNKFRQILTKDYIYYSISISAGKIPLVSPELHYYIGYPDIHIPVFTPEGFKKFNGY